MKKVTDIKLMVDQTDFVRYQARVEGKGLFDVEVWWNGVFYTSNADGEAILEGLIELIPVIQKAKRRLAKNIKLYYG